MQVIPSIDLKAGRSRLVFWPGAATGTGTPTDRPERIARHFVELGAPAVHLVDLDGAAAGRPVNTAAVQAIARAVATPLQLAGGVDGPEQIELAFAAGATRVVMPLLAVAEDPERLAACLRIAGDWLAVGLDARPERFAEVAWRGSRRRTLEDLVEQLARRRAYGGSCSPTAAPSPTSTALAGLIARSGAEFVLAGGVTDIGRLPGIRDAGVRAILLGEALLGGAIDFPAALAAAALIVDRSTPRLQQPADHVHRSGAHRSPSDLEPHRAVHRRRRSARFAARGGDSSSPTASDASTSTPAGSPRHPAGERRQADGDHRRRRWVTSSSPSSQTRRPSRRPTS